MYNSLKHGFGLVIACTVIAASLIDRLQSVSSFRMRSGRIYLTRHFFVLVYIAQLYRSTFFFICSNAVSLISIDLLDL